MNVYQDEPQGSHWDHTQTVIHPIVNYYIKDGKLVTEEHIMITDDLHHDKFAVRAFEKQTLDHLKAKGFIPMQIIQFCDNCAGQYKSKGPFQFVSESEIPILRMFFGARHGKGPADGVVGQIKSAAKRAVKSRKVVIRNAREFYNFCKVQFKHTAYDPSKSDQNFIQEFFFVEDIPRDDSEVVAVTTEHTHSYYSICSTGQFCVEMWQVSCCCESCLFRNGKDCPNQAYASKWKAINLHTGKAVVEENFRNLHWDLISHDDTLHTEPENESNTKSNAKSNADVQVYDYSESTESSDVANEPLPSYNFNSVYNEIQRCSTFSELEQYIDTLDLCQLPNLEKPVLQVSHNAKVDKIAVQALPTDAPPGLLPIETTGDGNCFPHAVSRAIFGNES